MQEEVLQLARMEDSLFYTTQEAIIRMSLKDGAVDVYPIDTSQKQMLAVERNMVLLCSPQKAVYIKF